MFGHWTVGWAVTLALAVLHWITTMDAASKIGTTFDETAHVVAGVGYVLHDDYRLDPENGALPQTMMGYAVLAGGHKFPPLTHPAWAYSDEWTMGYALLYESGNNLQKLLWDGRAAIAIQSALTVMLCYAMARVYLGPHWYSLVPPLIAAFSPTLRAHGGLMTSDCFMGFWYTLSPIALWYMLNTPTDKNHLVNTLLATLLGGFATGGLCVAKHSGVIIAFVVAILLPIRIAYGQRPASWKQASVVLAFRLLGAVGCVFFCVWWAYGFRYTAFVAGEAVQWKQAGIHSVLPPSNTLLHKLVMIIHEHKLLPEAFMYGFCYAVKSAVARNAFLTGHHGTGGWWWFFPFAVLVKTPVGTLVLCLMAIGCWLAAWVTRRRKGTPGADKQADIGALAYKFAPVVAGWIVYWAVAVKTNLNIGHRHMLPTYPAMFVLCGTAISIPLQWRGLGIIRKPMLAIAVIAVGAAVYEPLLHFDTPIAFFNALVGGPEKGYLHLVDSSLDWGQDLPRFRDFVDKVQKEEGRDTRVYLSYFGFGNPDHYGLDKKVTYVHGSVSGMGRPRHVKKTSWDLKPGYYAIGASMLQGVYNGQASGAWNAYYEAQYRRGMRMVKRLLQEGKQGEAILDANGEELQQMWKLVEWWDGSRIGRFSSLLRQRKPDHYIGYSILVYKVGAEELAKLQYGPAPLETGSGDLGYLRMGLNWNGIMTAPVDDDNDRDSEQEAAAEPDYRSYDEEGGEL